MMTSLATTTAVVDRYVRVRTQSSILGGKGGFGTLLRSSARQSGANLTTDFGACRDLQGRRLRHVNDEIKLRKWRETQAAKEKGLIKTGREETDAMFDTPSGLYNWHLMVPSWADISKKASRKIQRQFRRMQDEDDKLQAAKQEEKAQYERSVTMYVAKGTETSAQVKNNIASAVQQGILAQKDKKKRKREEELQQVAALSSSTPMAEDDTRPNSLCTLSGDVVVEEKQGSKVLQIQSQSDFATLAFFLDKPVAPSSKSAKTIVLYYEVCLVTGGLAQIGWADMMTSPTEFRPNSEDGDGVGDDRGSYGYDGSRGLKFHNGVEEVYPQSSWKAGDVVGCQYNVTTGELAYSLNGQSLGVAFTAGNVKSGTVLFPGISCNGGEILELYTRKEELQHLPASNKMEEFIPVNDLIADNLVVVYENAPSTSKPSANQHFEEDKKPAARESAVTGNDTAREATATVINKEKEPEKKEDPVKVEALDLHQYSSAEDLEELGLDRLKGALMAIGVKCGGSLHERAARLFSLKGLEKKDYPKKVRAKNFIL